MMNTIEFVSSVEGREEHCNRPTVPILRERYLDTGGGPDQVIGRCCGSCHQAWVDMRHKPWMAEGMQLKLVIIAGTG